MKIPIDFDSSTPEQRREAIIQSVSALMIVLREGKLQAKAYRPEEGPKGKGVVVPARFWRGLLDHELGPALLRPNDEVLDTGLCIRLWECLGRKSQPPRRLGLAFDLNKLKRLWPMT